MAVGQPGPWRRSHHHDAWGHDGPPDQYYGHIQHFKLEQLTAILKELNLTIVVARYWGLPFFSLQKLLTKRNFDRIRDRYMHGDLDWKKRAIFTATYYVYLLHDLVRRGPQIFIHARKNRSAVRAVEAQL